MPYKRKRSVKRKKSPVKRKKRPVKRKTRSVKRKKSPVKRKKRSTKKGTFLVFSAAGSPGTLVQLQARGIQDIHLTGPRRRRRRSTPRFVRRIPKRITTLSKKERRRAGSVFI